ncbi:MAG: metallophosphoesterase [Evtepia sp.]
MTYTAASPGTPSPRPPGKLHDAAGAYTLLVDAGDFIQGDPTVSASKGATAVEIMNSARYNYFVPGNHEFDYGYDNLKKLQSESWADPLAANILYNGEPAFGSSIILHNDLLGDKTIGLFGLATRRPPPRPTPPRSRV